MAGFVFNGAVRRTLLLAGIATARRRTAEISHRVRREEKIPLPAGGIVCHILKLLSIGMVISRLRQPDYPAPDRLWRLVETHGVTILGPLNIASQLPYHASMMYSRNVSALLTHLTSKEGRLQFDFEDEITRESCVTHDGRVLKGGTTGSPAPAPAPAGTA